MKKKKTGKKEWIAVIAALVAAVLIVGIFLTIETTALSAYEETEVVVAKTEVEAGTQVTDENVDLLFETAKMPSVYVITDPVRERKTLVGCVVEHNVHEKEMISRADLTNRTDWLDSLTEPIEFTFCASSVSAAVAGTIRGGDVIDVGITCQGTDGLAHFESVGRGIYVKESYDENGNPVTRSEKDAVCTMFCVVMEKTEGERMLQRLRDGDEVIVTLPR